MLLFAAIFVSVKSQNILVLDEPCGVSDTPYIEALENLNLTYQAANLDNIVTYLESGTWDLVIYSEYSSGISNSIMDALNEHLESGGKLIFSSWEIIEGHILFEKVGVEIISNFTTPYSMYIWAQSNLLNTPNSILEIPNPSLDPCHSDGFRLNAINGATVVAGFVYEDFTADYGAIVINAEETSIFMGQVPYMWTSEDIVPLLENQIFFLLFNNILSWTGAEDNDWFNPNNWEDIDGLNATPNEETSCIIPSVPSGNPDNFPVINQPGAICFFLKIEEQANLNINQGQELMVYNFFFNMSSNSTGLGKVVLISGGAKGTITNLEINTETFCFLSGTTNIDNLNIFAGNLKLNFTDLTINESLTGLTNNIYSTKRTKMNLGFDFDISENISELYSLIVNGNANMTSDLKVYSDLIIDGNIVVNNNTLSFGSYFEGQLVTDITSNLFIFDSELHNIKSNTEYKKVKTKYSSPRTKNCGAPKDFVFIPNTKNIKAAPDFTIPPITLNSLKIKRNSEITFEPTQYIFNNFEIIKGNIVDNIGTQIVINENFVNYGQFLQQGTLKFSGENQSEFSTYYYENATGGLENPIYNSPYYYNQGGFLFKVNEAITLKSFKIFAENTGNINVSVYDEDYDITFYDETYSVSEIGEQRLNIDNFYLEPGIYYLWWSGVSLQFDYDDDEAKSFFPITVGNDYIIILNDGWDWPYEYMSLYDWEYEIELQGNNNFEYVINSKENNGVLNFANEILIENSFTHISGTLTGEDINYAPEAFLMYANTDDVTTTSIEFSNCNNLTIMGGGNVFLHEDKTILSMLELNNGVLILDDVELLLGPNVDIMGGAGNSMVATHGTGKLSRITPSNGEYFFPIGNVDEMNSYAPVSMNISNMVRVFEPIISVRTVNEKHPENVSETHFLNRYWVVEDNNMASYDCDIQFDFSNSDLQGLSVWMNAVSWDADAGEWVVSGIVNPTSLSYSVADEEISTFYTGISKQTHLVEIFVIDGISEEAFENAQVIIYDGVNEIIQFTDENGYVFFNIIPGVYSISVLSECYDDVIVSDIDISEDFSNTYELFLTFYLIPVAFAGDDDVVCGNEYTLSAVDPDPITGTWSVVSGSATIESPSSPSTLVTASAFGVVTFKWTVVDGYCEDEDEVSITFKEIPVAFAGDDNVACGYEYVLSASDPGPFMGTWSVVSGSATIESPSSPSTLVTASAYGVVTFKWTVTEGLCDDEDEVSITFKEIPVAFAGDDDIVCGNEYTLSAVDPGPLTGTWSVVSGSATIESPSSPSTLVTASAFGVVTFKWTVADGICEDDDEVSITFKEIPVADFDFTANNLQVTFTNTSQSANSYIWDFGDESDTSEEVNPVHSYAQAGGYTVTLTASKDGCSDEYSELINVTYVNIVDVLLENITIYPNPTNGKVIIDFLPTSSTLNVKMIEVTDIYGRIIEQHQFVDFAANQFEVDLNGYAANVYILKVYVGENILQHKIIKR